MHYGHTIPSHLLAKVINRNIQTLTCLYKKYRLAAFTCTHTHTHTHTLNTVRVRFPQIIINFELKYKVLCQLLRYSQ